MRPANETKEEKFVRLAEARVNNISHQLKLIGNLSNINTYKYNNEQVAKIFDYIEEQVFKAKQQYKSTDSGKKKFFTIENNTKNLGDALREEMTEKVTSIYRKYDLGVCSEQMNKSISTIVDICLNDFNEHHGLYDELKDDERSMNFYL